MNFLRFFSGLYHAGLVLILAGVIMHVTETAAAPWVMAVGIVPVLGVRIYNFAIAPSQRKRPYAILMLSSFFLVAAVLAIYLDRSYWILFVAIAAVLDGYVSFRKYA
ncbi:MAG: hypothetical protein ACOCTO_03070 [Marinilabiliaceae bacterium]